MISLSVLIMVQFGVEMRFLLVSLTESEKITVNGTVGGKGEDWV